MTGAMTGTGVAPVVQAGAPPKWLVQLTTYYSDVNNGFGVWQGQDFRVLYAGRRISPFLSVGTQARPGGNQQVVSFGSYIPINRWLFAVVGLGHAPDRGTVLFPKLRADVSAVVTVPGVPGLLFSTGLTDVRYTDPRTGGLIGTLAPTLYKGKGIYSASVFLNRDRASGVGSGAWQVNAQWGQQGRYWVGGGLGSGTEAYRLLLATPFDARFSSQSANVFVTKWLTQRSGATVRLDLEQKTEVYLRKALTLTLFSEF
jgi:YaiO family outer membrane protein